MEKKLTKKTVLAMAKRVGGLCDKNFGKGWKKDPELQDSAVVAEKLQAIVKKQSGLKFNTDDLFDLVEVAREL